MLKAKQIRQKYLEFFEKKKRKIIPSASLVPENDPTALFTTAGMQPLVPYLMGEKHPDGNRLTNCQKCIRTSDIDEVGDNRHLTFFEMLGNWSLGSYFKKETIEWSLEFLTDKNSGLGLDPERIYVTVFKGEDNIPRDEESIKVWKKAFEKIKIKAEVANDDQMVEDKIRIIPLEKEDNFWIAGETGPCGGDTEMFYDTRPEEEKLKGKFSDLVNNFRLIEIWNDVFMEYEKKLKNPLNPPLKNEEHKKYEYKKLEQKNVDTGMGLERILTVLNNKKNIFETELFLPIIERIKSLSNKKYNESKEIKKSMRIIADHIKAAVFIVADGIEPSNVQRGYVLRRLVRRAIRHGHLLGIKNNFTVEITKVIQAIYDEVYPEINNDKILEILNAEEEKFRKTLEKGLKEFDKLQNYIAEKHKNTNELAYLMDGKMAFNLYQTYGFPLEMFFEELDNRQVIYIKNKVKNSFNKELKKHQVLSRTASAGMFKGGLADNKEKTTQLHTIAHLMLAGLRKVLGDHIHQKGSNINGERIRFDFSHPEKMTTEQKKKVENFVNEVINKKIDVVMEEMPLEEARKSGAEGTFENKYGDKVKVYTIEGYSKEICGGPHVKNTGNIQGTFKIKKEESSSAGIRRIKATIV